MQKGDIVIVFDCGATNVRVIAINSKGEILASESYPIIHNPILYILLTGYGMLMRSGIRCAEHQKKSSVR